MRIVSGGVTDLGRVRTNNEDCFRIVESLNLFVLADGMGGEAHGEVASALAVETIVKHCMDAQSDSGSHAAGPFGAKLERKDQAADERRAPGEQKYL